MILTLLQSDREAAEAFGDGSSYESQLASRDGLLGQAAGEVPAPVWERLAELERLLLPGVPARLGRDWEGCLLLAFGGDSLYLGNEGGVAFGGINQPYYVDSAWQLREEEPERFASLSAEEELPDPDAESGEQVTANLRALGARLAAEAMTYSAAFGDAALALSRCFEEAASEGFSAEGAPDWPAWLPSLDEAAAELLTFARPGEAWRYAHAELPGEAFPG